MDVVINIKNSRVVCNISSSEDQVSKILEHHSFDDVLLRRSNSLGQLSLDTDRPYKSDGCYVCNVYKSSRDRHISLIGRRERQIKINGKESDVH